MIYALRPISGLSETAEQIFAKYLGPVAQLMCTHIIIFKFSYCILEILQRDNVCVIARFKNTQFHY